MAEAVLMPMVGISVESCIITEWKKRPGDVVALGDILFEYETDKSSLLCESTAAGVLLEMFYEAGDEVPVLIPVCAIGQAGEDIGALRPEPAGAAAPKAQKPARAAAAANPILAETPPTGHAPLFAPDEVSISPRAKRVAEKHHVNPAFAAPSGPGGRVIEQDVRAAIAAGAGIGTGAAAALSAFGSAIGGRVGSRDAANTSIAPMSADFGGAYEDVVFAGVRKAISKSMSASLANIPQLTHHFSFDASRLLASRAAYKSKGGADVTINDMLLYAVSRILPRYPQLNSHMLDGLTQRRFMDVQLGMAVDTERGLMVPVIHNANHLRLEEIAATTKRLATAAREGTLLPDDMHGGTFTVSNLGALGVESFTPVINPPEAGILGICNIIERLRTKEDGGIALYPAMGLSLSYDHRAIDGAPASRFMMELCSVLENFAIDAQL